MTFKNFLCSRRKFEENHPTAGRKSNSEDEARNINIQKYFFIILYCVIPKITLAVLYNCWLFVKSHALKGTLSSIRATGQVHLARSWPAETLKAILQVMAIKPVNGRQER